MVETAPAKCLANRHACCRRIGHAPERHGNTAGLPGPFRRSIASQPTIRQKTIRPESGRFARPPYPTAGAVSTPHGSSNRSWAPVLA